MTSLWRSAAWRVKASRCWRWSRMFTKPRAPKMASRDPIRRRSSVALTVCVSQCHRRFSMSPDGAATGAPGLSVSGIGHRRRYYGSIDWNRIGARLVFFGEDGQVFGHHSEDGEAGGDDGAGDGQFCPLRNVVRAGGAFDAGDADVETVCDEAKNDHDRGEIESLRAVANFADTEQEERAEEEEGFDEEQALFVAADEHEFQDAAVIEIFETKNRVNGKDNDENASELAKNVELQSSAEILGAHRGFKDRHREANGDGGEKEESGKNRAIPEGMQLVGHDQVNRAQGRLMQGGKNDAADDNGDRNLLENGKRLLEVEMLKHDGREFQRQYRGVEH